jgi:hypothetical protein
MALWLLLPPRCASTNHGLRLLPSRRLISGNKLSSKDWRSFLELLRAFFVHIGAQRFFEWRARAQDLKSLKFELRFDIRKIDSWLGDLQRWRNAVNANAIATFYGYFDLSKFIYVTANRMFLSGVLYRYLGEDDIGALQTITTEFSLAWENMLNGQINNMKQNFVQANAVTTVDFWETKFRQHRTTLGNILAHLG